jgi:DNA-binding NtrC family response regulator
VLLDIFMPDKDGLETLMEMRRLIPDLRVITMSGQQWHRGMDVLGWSEKLGAIRTLPKPFGREALLAEVERALR